MGINKRYLRRSPTSRGKKSLSLYNVKNYALSTQILRHDLLKLRTNKTLNVTRPLKII